MHKGYVQGLIRQARALSWDGDKADQAKSLANLLEAGLEAGKPPDLFASVVRELRLQLNLIRDEMIAQNTRVVFGQWVRDMPAYQQEVELIQTTVHDPALREYLLGYLKEGDSYHGYL